MEYTFEVTVNGRTIRLVIPGPNEAAARAQIPSAIFAQEGIDLPENANIRTVGQTAGGAGGGAGGGASFVPPTTGQGGFAGQEYGPVQDTVANSPLFQIPDGPGRGPLLGNDLLDELRLQGDQSQAYRQTQRQVYGEAYDNSGVLASLLNEAAPLYQRAFDARQLADPQERSFTNFVRSNTPRDARRVAASSLLNLLEGSGVGINSSNQSAFLDTLSASSDLFGSAVGNTIRSRIPGVYDDLYALDVDGGRVSSDSAREVVDRRLPFLRELLESNLSRSR